MRLTRGPNVIFPKKNAKKKKEKENMYYIYFSFFFYGKMCAMVQTVARTK